MRAARIAGLGLAGLAFAAPAFAQGYRLRLDTRVLSASYRGLVGDSLPAGQVVAGSGGGLLTPDGYAAGCRAGATFCHFFRAGDKRTGLPWTTAADATIWGFGVTGLSLRMQARTASDLRSEADGEFPGTDPTVQLLEAYGELARASFTARAGRQTEVGRLGFQGFDGGRVAFRRPEHGLEAVVFGGWGLARGIAVPVTSPALNPLDDFQPRDRQLLVGAAAAWTHPLADLRGEWRHSVDPGSDYTVEHRAALSATFRPFARVRLSGGAEYDFANAWWGTADLGATYSDARLTATAEVRRYRPFFDLWTIWGAFSPVPHRTVGGSLAVVVVPWLTLDGRVEQYRYDDAEAEAPLALTEDDGWRVRLGGRVRIHEAWSLDGGYRYERGVGAAERNTEGGVTWHPGDRLRLRAEVAALVRPLEFRFSEVHARWYALTGDLRLGQRWRIASDLVWVDESRERPDAASVSWDQLRVSTRLVFTLGTDADRLPPGRRRPRVDPTAP